MTENAFNSSLKNSNLAEGDLRNSLNNPSAASFDRDNYISIGLLDEFFLKDLRRAFVSGTYHLSRSSFFGGINFRGTANDYSLKSSLSYSLRTSKYSYSAFQISYLTNRIISETGLRYQNDIVYYSFSHSQIVKSLKLSLILTTEHKLETNKIGLHPMFAFSYDIQNNTTFYGSIFNDNANNYLSINSGIKYKFKRIRIGVGLNINNLLPSLSISYDLKGLDVNISGAYHSYLGYESAFSLKM